MSPLTQGLNYRSACDGAVILLKEHCESSPGSRSATGRRHLDGLTENDGHENGDQFASNLQGIKLQNLTTLNTVYIL